MVKFQTQTARPGSSSSFCGQEQAGSLSLRCWEELCGTILILHLEQQKRLLCTLLLVEILFCFCIIPLIPVQVMGGMFSFRFAAFLCSPRLWETLISSCFHTASPSCSTTSRLFESCQGEF